MVLREPIPTSSTELKVENLKIFFLILPLFLHPYNILGKLRFKNLKKGGDVKTFPIGESALYPTVEENSIGFLYIWTQKSRKMAIKTTKIVKKKKSEKWLKMYPLLHVNMFPLNRIFGAFIEENMFPN